MPSVHRQLAVPRNLYERALWIDEELPELMRRVPMHLGIQGVAHIESAFFPKHAPIVPLDPTCPTCGVETDDGQVERIGDVYRVAFESCGHVLEMTAAELESRLARKS